MHHFELAFDVVPLDAGKPIWNVSDPFWQRVGRTGKEYGLEWAGDWKRLREYAHFQYTGRLGLAEIREGQRPATSWPAVPNHKLESPLNEVSEKDRSSSLSLIN